MGCAVAAPGGFSELYPDVGLAPLKLERTQARTRRLMTEGCFSQTEDYFPSPLFPLLLSPLPSFFPFFSPSLLALSHPPLVSRHD